MVFHSHVRDWVKDLAVLIEKYLSARFTPSMFLSDARCDRVESSHTKPPPGDSTDANREGRESGGAKGRDPEDAGRRQKRQVIHQHVESVGTALALVGVGASLSGCESELVRG